MADLHHQRVLELDRRNRQHDTSRYRSLLLHWMARRLRRPTAVDPAPLPPVESGQVAITWGGHASAMVRYSRLSILCDPVLARSVHGVKRELAPGLPLDALATVDLVLIGHAAPDHLDLGTLARLSRAATVVVPPGAAARVSPLGFARLVELGVGSALQHRGIEVIAEAAQHGERGSPSVSYVVRGDGPTVYFCGASGYFSGFADIGRRHLPDLALLPIAGYWPRSFRRWHMSPLDALYAFEDLRARVMVPIRYGTFALSYERVGDPERWLAELVAERHLERFVVRLGAGESRVFVPPGTAALESSRYEVDGERAGDRISAEPREPAGTVRAVRPAGRPVGDELRDAFASELRAREKAAPPDRLTVEPDAVNRQEVDRRAGDPLAVDRLVGDPFAADRLVGEPFAADRSARDPFAADRSARDPFPADRLVGEQVAVDRRGVDQVAADRRGVDQVAADRLAVERVAAELAAELGAEPHPLGGALDPGDEARSIEPLGARSRETSVRSRPGAAAAREGRVPSGRRRPVALPAPTVESSAAEPDAFTLPGGLTGGPRPPGPPPPPRRPALIIDRDDETNVFEPADVTRVRDEVHSPEDLTVAGPPIREDDDAAATRDLDLDRPDTETMPVPVPVPGSR